MENETQNKWGTRHGAHKGIVALFLLVLMVYVGSLAYTQILKSKYIGLDVTPATTINVTGDADVYSTPDLAVMDFTVLSEAKTVADAMKDNSAKTNAINAAVKVLGVEDKDLQTTNFDISPRYDYVKTVITPVAPPTPMVPSDAGSVTQSSTYYPDGKQVLSGYDVTSTLTVKMRDLSKVGDIIQAATTAGANQAGSLQFTIDNPDAVQAQARQQAIAKAKAQAQTLADQLGVKLVRITSFSENNVRPIEYNAKSVAMDMAVAAPAAPAIATGQNKVSDSVTITYEIR